MSEEHLDLLSFATRDGVGLGLCGRRVLTVIVLAIYLTEGDNPMRLPNVRTKFYGSNTVRMPK